jgi:phosphatidate cytidylyltransferase
LISVAIATSIIGDLAFSLFKRKNNIKDYGNFIAGHGGILDRFDSWLIEIGVLHFILITISLFSTIFLGFDKSHNRIFNVV